MRSKIPKLIAAIGLIGCLTAEPAGALGPDPSQLPAPPSTAELSPRLASYVNQIAALEPAYLAPDLEYPTIGLLPGWRDKVCPQVSGLTRQQGEFVLARLSDIARAAGIRVSGHDCKPNIFIYVTDRPRDLLKSMEQRNPIGMFGYRGRPYLIDQFIDTPRPVRVWYNVAEGAEVSFRFAFAGILVVADRAQLQHLSLGQLADYLGIVSFAEIKPGAHVGDDPTILKLFDGNPQVAPSGMSDWDQVFLKTLYDTETWPTPFKWRRTYCCELHELAVNMVDQISR